MGSQAKNLASMHPATGCPTHAVMELLQLNKSWPDEFYF